MLDRRTATSIRVCVKGAMASLSFISSPLTTWNDACVYNRGVEVSGGVSTQNRFAFHALTLFTTAVGIFSVAVVATLDWLVSLTQRTESLKLKQTPKNEHNQSEEVSQAIAASLTASDEHGIPTPMFQCGGACR